MDDKKSFEAARAESIAANREFIQGNPEPLKRLYSDADDIIFRRIRRPRAWMSWRPRRALIGRPRSSPAEVSKRKT